MSYISIVIIIILGGLYLKYSQDKLTTEKLKLDYQKKASLEKYMNQKHLFQLYGDYLYQNIDFFKEHYTLDTILPKLEQDHPTYGDGIKGNGIMRDFIKHNLISTDILGKKIMLGEVFQIISISYPNFIKFKEDINSSNIKFVNIEGGYSSLFGDKITSKIFCFDINENTRMYLGLSTARGYYLNECAKRHKKTIVEDQMYLFVELRKSKYSNGFNSTNSESTYPHFDIIKLKKDITLSSYHKFYLTKLNICKTLGDPNLKSLSGLVSKEELFNEDILTKLRDYDL